LVLLWLKTFKYLYTLALDNVSSEDFNLIIAEILVFKDTFINNI